MSKSAHVLDIYTFHRNTYHRRGLCLLYSHGSPEPKLNNKLKFPRFFTYNLISFWGRMSMKNMMKPFFLSVTLLLIISSCGGNGSMSGNTYEQEDSSDFYGYGYGYGYGSDYGGINEDPTPVRSVRDTEVVLAHQYHLIQEYDGSGYWKPTNNSKYITIQYYSDGSAQANGYSIQYTRINGYDYEISEGRSLWVFNANGLN